MPPFENSHHSNFRFTPEPHCVPGYTGYLPGFGPHKQYQFGKTFRHMTHDIMERHPVAGDRFGDISTPRGSQRDDIFFLWQRQQSTIHPLLRTGMVPGYTGHIPRKDFSCGENYAVQCNAGIAEFERLRMDNEDRQRHTKYVPPEDLLPRNITFSSRLCERLRHRTVPSYATFTNPMNYGQSVYNMSDLDPRKTYMPGYTGYYTGKCYDTGVTHARGAHQDLCDLTSSRLERQVAEKRPKINDWYRCPVLYPPRPPEMDAYHPRQAHSCGPVPGYAGHIPGYRDCCMGESFGKSAGAIIKEKEMTFCNRSRNP